MTRRANTQSAITTLLKALIAIDSVTPVDKGCQALLSQQLVALGFSVESLPNAPVDNLWARLGDKAPLFVFAGHTDVVDTGPLEQWHCPPYEATIKGDTLYGRGAADMKGSLAAMVVACQAFLADTPTFNGSIGFLITSGEEGDHFDLGTPYVMETLKKRGETIDYCVIGEPSSTRTVGDVIKVGRRGSLTANVDVSGQQGHVAYPHLANNPIHALAPALAKLCQTKWDEGNASFPPTSLQMTELHSGVGQSNVIPGELHCQFNFRYSTETNAEELQKKVATCFEDHQIKCKIHWRLNGQPFLTSGGRLIESTIAAIKEHTGQVTDCSTSGGTSDGRFIAPYGVELVELGPVNATIHQVNECVDLKELATLADIYTSLCKKLLT